jgi:hypothetical protein
MAPTKSTAGGREITTTAPIQQLQAFHSFTKQQQQQLTTALHLHSYCLNNNNNQDHSPMMTTLLRQESNASSTSNIEYDSNVVAIGITGIQGE